MTHLADRVIYIVVECIVFVYILTGATVSS